MSYKFGLCPHCQGTDGYLNIGRFHWFVCDVHKTRWHTASGVLGWQDEDQDTWERNADLLEEYTEVEPVIDRRMATYPCWKYGELNG